MDTAVLFLVFNRLDTTRRAFAAIRAARPARLYVSADGPRPNRPGEAERCAEVRRIATSVDWPCKVKTLFRDENLGCKNGVSGGIDWFFEHEEEGIIIEDDIVPDPSFFPYCTELLSRYRDDSRVAMISGCSEIGDKHGAGSSYVFSRYLHVWGWASWRRAWACYDVSMAEWPSAAAAERVATVLGGRRAAIAYWSAIFDRMTRGEIDTWDYQWVFSSWMHDMVAVFPSATMIENIGFGADATHTLERPPELDAPKPMTFPLRHPTLGNTAATDAIVERVAYGLTRGRRLRAQAKRVPGVRQLAALMRSSGF